MRLKQIYKITYPNNRIYIGSDLKGDLHYCGSPSSVQRIAEDLGISPRDVPRYPLARQTKITRDGNCITIKLLHLQLTLRKEILWESATAYDRTVRKLELQFIRKYRANDPAVGYNLRPKYQEESSL